MRFFSNNTLRLVMRIPMIKFRKGGKPQAHGSSGAAGTQAKAPSKGASVATSEDTPARYQRKPFSAEEIDYINRGGPA